MQTVCPSQTWRWSRRHLASAPLALGPVPVEQLLGVRPGVLDQQRDRGVPARVYVPFGPDWFRDWLRRLAESFGA